MGPARKPIAERFWQKVAKCGPDECWPWTGSKEHGYGKIGAPGDGKAPLRAPRVSWEIHNGPIPDGLWVLHRCDNRACVNPKHLFLGTPADNTADMIAKGRKRLGDTSGTKNGRAKLTEGDVLAIRSDCRRQVDIASDYGIEQTTVSAIKRGISWSHLGEDENQ